MKKTVLLILLSFLIQNVFGNEIDSTLKYPCYPYNDIDFNKAYFCLNSAESKETTNREYFYNPTEKSFWSKLWGEPTQSRLLIGMFSWHLMSWLKPSTDPNKRGDNWNNELIAISYHGYFAGTLINSLYNRAYVAGIERYWFTTTKSKNFSYSLGYRLGLITGYTQKTFVLAKYSPVLPFPQLIFDMHIMHVDVELSWCIQVFSAGFGYRF